MRLVCQTCHRSVVSLDTVLLLVDFILLARFDFIRSLCGLLKNFHRPEALPFTKLTAQTLRTHLMCAINVYYNFGKHGPIFNFLSPLNSDLWKKLELKRPTPLKYVAALPCKN